METRFHAEPDQFHGAEVRDHHIVGGQLLVEQALPMQRGERIGQLPHHPGCLKGAQRSVFQQLRQRTALCVFADDVPTEPAGIILETDRV